MLDEKFRQKEQYEAPKDKSPKNAPLKRNGKRKTMMAKTSSKPKGRKA